MLFDYSNVLVFLVVGSAFILVSLTLGRMLRPNAPSPEKLSTYECGEIPVQGAWVNFNMRFYMLALLFIIFDVEIALMLPVVVVFKQWVRNGSGSLALAEMGVFVGILLLGLVYAWVKGDLEWVKKVLVAEKAEGLGMVSKASKI